MSDNFDLYSMLLAIGYVNKQIEADKIKDPEAYRQEVEGAYNYFHGLSERIPPSF